MMSASTTFDELLDAVERLTPEQQANLVSVIQHRLAEQGRRRVVEDVREARAEFSEGGAREVSVAELMREIQS